MNLYNTFIAVFVFHFLVLLFIIVLTLTRWTTIRMANTVGRNLAHKWLQMKKIQNTKD